MARTAATRFKTCRRRCLRDRGCIIARQAICIASVTNNGNARDGYLIAATLGKSREVICGNCKFAIAQLGALSGSFFPVLGGEGQVELAFSRVVFLSI